MYQFFFKKKSPLLFMGLCENTRKMMKINYKEQSTKGEEHVLPALLPLTRR